MKNKFHKKIDFEVGEFTRIDDDVKIGKNVKMGNFCVIKEGVEIGDNTICLEEGANMYINSLGGKKLYNSKNFKYNGIDLRFLEHSTTQYSQFDNEFVSGLSIIDVLMFNSPQKIKCDLLLDYNVIK